MVDASSFRFACPKCKSLSGHSVTRLNTASYSREGKWDDRIFACMCGKRLYGEAIREEYDRQWEAVEAQLKKEERARRQQRESERKQQTEAVAVAVEEARLVEEEQRCQAGLLLAECAWKDCKNEARSISKYCSRTCSNRNARHRYKVRKKEK
jgi:hypothetical protein